MKEYQIEIPVFNGPLDLLLYLIERDELDITTISLMRVTEQYLSQVELMEDDRVENLIDFLGVSARLVLIKSRALLPKTPLLPGQEEEEEDPAEALLRQLKAYKRFKNIAGWLKLRQDTGLHTYLRLAPPPRLEGRLDLSGVDANTLAAALENALERRETLTESVELARPRVLTIDDRLHSFRQRLRSKRPFSFDSILSGRPDRTEISLTLLALLELIKQREAAAIQNELFGPIEIRTALAEAAGVTNDPDDGRS